VVFDVGGRRVEGGAGNAERSRLVGSERRPRHTDVRQGRWRRYSTPRTIAAMKPSDKPATTQFRRTLIVISVLLLP
jgi:hypothetical protein